MIDAVRICLYDQLERYDLVARAKDFYLLAIPGRISCFVWVVEVVSFNLLTIINCPDRANGTMCHRNEQEIETKKKGRF